jgi:hypothetical protein
MVIIIVISLWFFLFVKAVNSVDNSNKVCPRALAARGQTARSSLHRTGALRLPVVENKRTARAESTRRPNSPSWAPSPHLQVRHRGLNDFNQSATVQTERELS